MILNRYIMIAVKKKIITNSDNNVNHGIEPNKETINNRFAEPSDNQNDIVGTLKKSLNDVCTEVSPWEFLVCIITSMMKTQNM